MKKEKNNLNKIADFSHHQGEAWHSIWTLCLCLCVLMKDAINEAEDFHKRADKGALFLVADVEE